MYTFSIGHISMSQYNVQVYSSITMYTIQIKTLTKTYYGKSH